MSRTLFTAVTLAATSTAIFKIDAINDVRVNQFAHITSRDKIEVWKSNLVDDFMAWKKKYEVLFIEVGKCSNILLTNYIGQFLSQPLGISGWGKPITIPYVQHGWGSN